MPYVIQYPGGQFQGYPITAKPYSRFGRDVRFVENLEDARVYSTPTAARNSIARDGGEVKAVGVVLLEPK